MVLDKNIEFLYKFNFPSSKNVEFRIEIDTKTKSIVQPFDLPPEYAQMAKFDFYRCSNCANKQSGENCPVAHNLVAVAAPFKDNKSFDPVRIEVVSQQRTYIKEGSIQQGLQSLFGLIMASSGCKHLEFLAPMSIFHLPFADENETMFRVIGLYLVERFFTSPQDPLSLEGLHKRYKRVEEVNKGIAERISALESQDAGKNALVILDTYIKMFSLEYERGLDRMRDFFSPSE